VAFRGLNGLIDTRSHIEATDKTWSAAFTFFSRLDAQIMNRIDASNINANIMPDFPLSFKVVQDGQIKIIGYRLKDGKIEIGVANETGGPAKTYSVMNDIRTLTIRTMDQNGKWTTIKQSDPGLSSSIDGTALPDTPTIPRCLDVSLTLSTGESLHREWPL
jgi:hypothetical protein